MSYLIRRSDEVTKRNDVLDFSLAKHVRWPVKLKLKAYRDDPYQRRITSRQWRPTLTRNPHCQLAGLEQSSSPLNRMQSYWLNRKVSHLK
jgi:hypothetical protein